MTLNYLGAMTDEQLADSIFNDLRLEALNRGHRQRLEQELTRRMEAQGATEMAHPTLLVRLQQDSPTYDPSKLRRLYEVLPREEVDKVVTPAHEEVVQVPEKWDARRFKGLARFGAEAAGIILEARLPGQVRLRVSEKETKP